MSHWRKYSSNVLDDVKMDLLTKACNDVGVTYDTSIKHVGSTYGSEGANVDAGIKKDGRELQLGFIFKQEDGKTKLVLEGDFWGSGLNERNFVDNLAQHYKKHKIIQQAENQGWFFDKNETDKDGNIILEAYAY